MKLAQLRLEVVAVGLKIAERLSDVELKLIRLDAARERLGCDDAFPAVYDKVKSEAGISDLSAEIAAEEKLSAEGKGSSKKGR